MTTRRKLSNKHSFVNNPLARVLGQSAPAYQVMQQAAQTGVLPMEIRPNPSLPATDYTLIDPSLTVTAPPVPAHSGRILLDALPPTGAGYAAFTPIQRYALIQWLNHPEEPAPPAFQQFYLAQLEVGLLEPPQAASVTAEVQRLQGTPAWRQHIGLARLRLFADWLAQDGRGLAGWVSGEAAPGAVLGVGLGLQALLKQPLQPQQLPSIFRHWSMDAGLSGIALLTLRLSSLAATLGSEPLTYALAQLGESAQQPQPWRSQHRDLRIALPQPDLRPVLEPLLRDLTVMQEERDNDNDEITDSTDDDSSASGWHLVLEFGESRSDFFSLALTAAQKQPGYLALMDENRRMIHRIHFRKGEVRRFWRLWDYVQSWSSTKVYLNGDEVSKFELYGRLWQVR